MQLVSGATGQAYNRRKNRKGAFWEDRFYTTVIEDGVHLLRCMAYIELNMVRAGAVKHPKDWEFGIQYKIKAFPTPSFKVKQYGQIRVNNDLSSRKNDHHQDYAISESQTAYDADYASENWDLRGDNAVLWTDFPFTTTGYQGQTLLTSI